MPKNTDIFEPAITQMEEKGDSVFGPMSFSCYCDENKLTKPSRTADFLSIQSIENLPSSLREKQIMILRLGRAKGGKDTQFALVQTTDLKTFFLEDQEIFTETKEKEYIPPDNYRDSLLIYELAPVFSETTLVSLAIDSGLLGQALNLDPQSPLPKAVNIHSSFEFDMRFHSSIKETCKHRKGQIQVDGMFLGYRNNENFLFVVEAKCNRSKSLAKHKLVYSVLSICNNQLSPIHPNISIVPIYLKIARYKNKISYQIVECELPDPRKKVIAIDELMPPEKHTQGKHTPEKHTQAKYTHLSLVTEHLKFNQVTQSSEL